MLANPSTVVRIDKYVTSVLCLTLCSVCPKSVNQLSTESKQTKENEQKSRHSDLCKRLKGLQSLTLKKEKNDGGMLTAYMPSSKEETAQTNNLFSMSRSTGQQQANIKDRKSLLRSWNIIFSHKDSKVLE